MNDIERAPNRAAPGPVIDAGSRPASRLTIAWLQRVHCAWWLIAMTGAALILRLAGITWGANYYMHPDELFMTMVATEIDAPRSVSQYLDTATSPLNPYNGRFGSYVYGTFPLFMGKLLGSLTGHEVFGNAHLPGRWLSAIVDTGSVLLVFWIGRRLFGRLVGLLGSFLLTFTVLDIQAAHFFTTDAMAAFFATATFALILHAWHRRGFGWYALAGLAAGLAAASKPNLLLTFGFLALPLLETIRLSGWRAVMPDFAHLLSADTRQNRSPVLLASALAGLVAIWTFRFAQPYAFADATPFSFRLNPQWTSDLAYWRRAQAGAIDLPPSIQWAGRAPVLFIVENMVRWGMGPGMGLAALAGLGILTWRTVTARSWPSWWMLGIVGWVVFHILLFGTSLGKAQRYLLPAYPLMAMLAALTLDRLIHWARSQGALWLPGFRLSIRLPSWCHPGYVIPALAIVSTMLYGIAFTTIFTKEHSRVTASEWMFDNIPAGSTIATEYWDFGLPIWLPGKDVNLYQSFPLDLYRTDSAEKLSVLIGQLQRTDYIVLSSNRLFDSIPRMPWRYPMTTAYYQALFSGELGFDQVGHFTSYPELFGISLDDRNAEESLTVYDHPEVFIFRKSASWSDKSAWYLLHDALGQGGLPLLPVQTQPDSMMLDATEQAALAQTGTWSAIFTPCGLTNQVPLLFWYLALQLLTLPAVPLLWRLLPHLPDRGYALAKTLGTAAIGWIAWLLTTATVMDFGIGSIVVAWLAVAAAGLLAVRARRTSLVRDLRANRPWIIMTELLFGGVFLAAAGFRALNPDIWPAVPGRSTLLDIGVFNATIRTASFPPYDPWFANGTVHDVYLGYVPWAVVTRLTGILPEVAFSLTIVTLFALLCLNAWIAAATIIVRFRPGPAPPVEDHSTGRIAGFALFAPLMLAGLGSLGFAKRAGAAEWAAPSRFRGDRVMEFPLLSFVSGDLGPTQLAMPLVVAAIAISAGFTLQNGEGEMVDRRPFASVGGWRPALQFIALVGFLFGFLLTANWLMALPILALMAGLTYLAAGTRCAWNRAWSLVRDVGCLTFLIALAGGLAFFPFFDGFGRFPRTTEALPQSLGLGDYLLHFGVLLAIVAGYLVVHLLTGARRNATMNPGGNLAVIGFGLGALVFVTLVIATGNIVLVLFMFLVFIAVAVWSQQHDIRHLAILGMATLALALGIISERVRLVAAVGDQTIQNQFWELTWILLAIVAAPALTLAFESGSSRASRRSRRPTPRRSWVGLAGLAVLLTAAAAYPVQALPNRASDQLSDTPPTLNGFRFLRDAEIETAADGRPVAPYTLAGDGEAIDWLRQNVRGLPIILEAPAQDEGGPGGRISAMTGFPTVIGSTVTEMQRRPGMEPLALQRFADVTEIYSRPGSLALVEPLLRTYGVSLIYVGPVERATYPQVGLLKFDQAVGEGRLRIVYQSATVTIYSYSPAPPIGG